MTDDVKKPSELLDKTAPMPVPRGQTKDPTTAEGAAPSFLEAEDTDPSAPRRATSSPTDDTVVRTPKADARVSAAPLDVPRGVDVGGAPAAIDVPVGPGVAKPAAAAAVPRALTPAPAPAPAPAPSPAASLAPASFDDEVAQRKVAAGRPARGFTAAFPRLPQPASSALAGGPAKPARPPQVTPDADTTPTKGAAAGARAARVPDTAPATQEAPASTSGVFANADSQPNVARDPLARSGTAPIMSADDVESVPTAPIPMLTGMHARDLRNDEPSLPKSRPSDAALATQTAVASAAPQTSQAAQASPASQAQASQASQASLGPTAATEAAQDVQALRATFGSPAWRPGDTRIGEHRHSRSEITQARDVFPASASDARDVTQVASAPTSNDAADVSEFGDLLSSEAPTIGDDEESQSSLSGQVPRPMGDGIEFTSPPPNPVSAGDVPEEHTVEHTPAFVPVATQLVARSARSEATSSPASAPLQPLAEISASTSTPQKRARVGLPVAALIGAGAGLVVVILIILALRMMRREETPPVDVATNADAPVVDAKPFVADAKPIVDAKPVTDVKPAETQPVADVKPVETKPVDEDGELPPGDVTAPVAPVAPAPIAPIAPIAPVAPAVPAVPAPVEVVGARDGFGPFVNRATIAGAGIGQALGRGVRAMLGDDAFAEDGKWPGLAVRGEVRRAQVKDGVASVDCALTVMDANKSARAALSATGTAPVENAKDAALRNAADRCGRSLDADVKSALDHARK